jgi:hypothetical protein
MKIGTKTQKALHELYFHPETGFIVWMHHFARFQGRPAAEVPFKDLGIYQGVSWEDGP